MRTCRGAEGSHSSPRITCVIRIASSQTKHENIESLIATVDVLSLHANLSESTKHLVRADRIALAKKGLLVVNTSRAELVHMPDMIAALNEGTVGGYATDVLDEEPPPADHPLLKHPKALITPHIGSRTYESVVRQATAAVKNLILAMHGEKPLAQINPEVPVKKVV